MGTEALWIPAVISAVAGAATIYNTQRTAKKQDKAAAQQIENQAKKGREADKKVTSLIDQTAASNPNDARAKSLQAYTAALKGGNASATQGMGQRSGGSDRFNEEIAEAALGVGQYGSARAGLQSTVDAAGNQRREEAYGRMRTGTDLDLVKRAASAQAYIDSLKVAGVQRNPWIDAGAAVANGVAGGMSAGGGSSAGAASTGAAGAFTPSAYNFGAGGNSTLYQGQSAFGGWGARWT